MHHLEKVNKQLLPLIEKIKNHSLYYSIHTLKDLQIFMEHHVFAVWDFMCLLKVLHSRIVSTHAPWFPPQDSHSAHLIGQILLEEESDKTQDSKTYCSHFELYLQAMASIGADTKPIQTFLAHLAQGDVLIEAAESVNLPTSVQQFILTTFGFFSQEAHILAAAFVYGREAITSSLFRPLVQQLELTIPSEQKFRIQPLLYYLNRHIVLDDTEHLPRALQMLINLTGDDPKKWQEIILHSRLALQARLEFLKQIELKLNNFDIKK